MGEDQHLRRALLDDAALEQSGVVANCRMNREREIVGTNSYTADLRLNPLKFLQERLQSTPRVAWLDLCCGSGRALIQAAECFRTQGFADRVRIVGIDLVPMFQSQPPELSLLRLMQGSLPSWNSDGRFDLITCVHGLHYVGDKLGIITRAASWLTPDGLFLAHLDLRNVRLVDRRNATSVLVRAFKAVGLNYDRSRRIVSCHGHRTVHLPYVYLGADDSAGPNFTGQPAVASIYALE